MSEFTFAQYVADPATGENAFIRATLDGQDISVPIHPDNRHYVAIMASGVAIQPATPISPPAPELSREAFCVALIEAGILTEAEATEAALGVWPSKFEPALTGKSLVEKLTIKNVWQATKTVPRNAPLFADLLTFYAGIKGLGPQQAQALGDRIFALA